MTLRLRDWPERLDALIAERRDAPFAWGTNDCCLFAADAVLACSGVDVAAELRGAYHTAAEAADLLEERGGVERLAEATLGDEVLPQQAQPGDIGLVFTGGRHSLAVCGGAHWHAPGAERLETLPREAATRAWRLPLCRR